MAIQNPRSELRDVLEQTAAASVDRRPPYPLVHRLSLDPPGECHELFETLCDALRLESRLRVDPPGEWLPERETIRERSWSGYGHVVRLRKSGRVGSWSVFVDGSPVLEDASRLDAFEAAAERMHGIAMNEAPTTARAWR